MKKMLRTNSQKNQKEVNLSIQEKSKANNKKHSHSWVATRLNASEISINNWLIGDSRCKVSSSPLKLFFVRSEETGTRNRDRFNYCSPIGIGVK